VTRLRIAFVLLTGTFAGVLGAAWFTLPDQVAVHFDLGGAADRVVSRERAVLELGVVGAAVAALMGGVATFAPRVPLWAVNVPRKEYWSRPENEPRLRSRLARDAWVVADLTMALLVTVVIFVLTAANTREPSLGAVPILVLGGFVAAILGYALWSRRHYRPGPTP
jgi:hypothetical protein